MITFNVDPQLTQTFPWQELEKIEAFKASVMSLSNSLWMPRDICLDITSENNVRRGTAIYEMVVKVEGETVYSRNFRQTTVDSFRLSVDSFQEFLEKVISTQVIDGLLPIGWVKLLEVSDLPCTRSLSHKLLPGVRSSSDGAIQESRWGSMCEDIMLTEAEIQDWKICFVDGDTFYIPPSGWTTEVKSLEELAAKAAETESQRADKSFSVAQKYIGWTVASVGSEVTLTSSTGETVAIKASHEVWDYGEMSQSWLVIGGDRLYS